MRALSRYGMVFLVIGAALLTGVVGLGCQALTGESMDAGATAGSGGTAIAGGGQGGAPSGGGGAGGGNPVQSCNGGEPSANDDREHATAYTVGAPLRACLDSDSDVDFYQFSAPATPAQGGYFMVRITDVGTTGSVAATLYAASDGGEFGSTHNYDGGGSVFFWFAAKAGASYQLKVTEAGKIERSTPYTLTAVFNPVNDTNEPNDDNAHAAPLTVGQPATGFLFAGYVDSTPPADASWEDHFKVTLPAGDVTIALTNLASDMAGRISLYNPDGTEIAEAHSYDGGSSVVLKKTLAANEAGACYVRVAPTFHAPIIDTGSTVPAYFGQPYTLKVTAP